MRTPNELYSVSKSLWRLRTDPPRMWYGGLTPVVSEQLHWDKILLDEACVSDAPFVLTKALRLSEGMLVHLMRERDVTDWVRLVDMVEPLPISGPREVWIYLGSLSELEDLRPTRMTPRPFPAQRPGAGESG